LSQEKEVNGMLKELLEKYSLTVEDLTAKGIDFNEISEDELEAKIVEVFEIEANPQPEGEGDGEQNPEGDGEGQEPEGQEDPEANPEGEGDTDPEGGNDPEQDLDNQEGQVDVEALQSRIQDLETENHSLTTKVQTLETEIEGLRQFKLDVEKADHEAKVATMFSNFQLSEEDVEGLDIHAFSLDEIEEKCYAILGKKLAKNKNFSKQSKDEGIKLPINNKDEDSQPENPYGDLFEKYNK